MRASLFVAMMVVGGILAQSSTASAQNTKKPWVLFMVIGGSPKETTPPIPPIIHNSLYFDTKEECVAFKDLIYSKGEIIRGAWCVQAYVVGMP